MKTQILNIFTKLKPVEKYLEEKQKLYSENIKLKKELKALKEFAEKRSSGAKSKQIMNPHLKREISISRLKDASNFGNVKKQKKALIINWIIPIPLRGSGGHADIIRAVRYLEKSGHKCRMYIYDYTEKSDITKASEIINSYGYDLSAEIFYNEKKYKESDIVFATNWKTAYLVNNLVTFAKKYYFVQDFEGWFSAHDSMSVFAENTYKMGFRGITLGKWLSEKLNNEYGMQTEYINFGYDRAHYYLTNVKVTRKGIVFYAQPDKPRRGFELGVLALELFSQLHPDYTIHFFGADLSVYDLNFPYVNHGIISPDELNDLYNQCVAGLTISLSNLSLVPLEMMSAGCQPVINEAEFTTKIPYAKNIVYSEPTPQRLAEALSMVVRNTNSNPAQKLSDAAKTYSWEASHKKFVNIITRDVKG